MSFNWRASLVPAAAVIPAPIAYVKVVAVRKLVVGFLLRMTRPPSGCACGSALTSCNLGPARVTIRFWVLVGWVGGLPCSVLAWWPVFRAISCFSVSTLVSTWLVRMLFLHCDLELPGVDCIAALLKFLGCQFGDLHSVLVFSDSCSCHSVAFHLQLMSFAFSTCTILWFSGALAHGRFSVRWGRVASNKDWT